MKHLKLSPLLLVAAFIMVGCAGEASDLATATSLPIPTPIPTALPPDAGWACAQQPSPAWGGSGLGDPLAPFWGNGGYDVQHYDIDLNVDVEDNYVQGETTLTVEATQELDAFNLDFLGMEIANLLVNDAEAVYCRDDVGEMTIIPQRPLTEGQLFTVLVSYDGTPVITDLDYGSHGWLKVDDGVLTSGPPNDPAYLYPNNEYKSELATYTIKVTVPDEYQVSSVGSLEESNQEDGLVTTIWDLTVPITHIGLSINRDVTIKTLAGPDGLPIRFQYPSSLEDYFEETILDLPEMVDFFSSLFGPFPYDRIGITVVSNRAILIAVPTLIFASSADHEGRMARGLSSQWVGHSIRARPFEATWVVLGIQSYAEPLWLEHQGQSADDLIRTLYLNFPDATYPPGSYSPEVELGDEIYDVLWDRPMVAVHALRKRVGDEAFFSILKTFTTRFKGDLVSSDDFISLAEEISGQELDTFFDAWIYQEAIPDIPDLNLSKNNGEQ